MSKKLNGKAKQAARKKTKAKQSGSRIYDKLAKDSSANEKLDLHNYFWDLGDGDEVSKHRVDIVKGFLGAQLNNIDNLNTLVKNAKNYKTLGIGGFAFQIGSIFKQFNDIHIGPTSGCDVDTMLDIFAEFLQADNPMLAPCMTGMSDGTISQAWGYIGAKGNLAIKWAEFGEENCPDKTLTFITAIKAETCNTRDYSQRDDMTLEEFAKGFMAHLEEIREVA
jgi:hypothetical protein